MRACTAPGRELGMVASSCQTWTLALLTGSGRRPGWGGWMHAIIRHYKGNAQLMDELARRTDEVEQLIRGSPDSYRIAWSGPPMVASASACSRTGPGQRSPAGWPRISSGRTRPRWRGAHRRSSRARRSCSSAASGSDDNNASTPAVHPAVEGCIDRLGLVLGRLGRCGIDQAKVPGVLVVEAPRHPAAQLQPVLLELGGHRGMPRPPGASDRANERCLLLGSGARRSV